MKTITFYSYKGGVGRSLALSNIAIRLAEFNKKVCVIDFDLDAPGLQFKFRNSNLQIKKGIVDYIHEFSCNNRVPEDLKDFIVNIPQRNRISQPIQFLPAGNIDNDEYWHLLTSIKWNELLYSNESKGIEFFLDLKAKIEKQLSPDFLLIDSRTGITDMSGVTLRLLADEVVVLSTINQENLYGSKKVIKNLLDPSKALFGKTPKINFILTRLPFDNKPQEIETERGVVEKIQKEFKELLNVTNFDILKIHSDKSLEKNEKQMIGDDYEQNTVSISNDYLQLFDILTSDALTTEERERFKNIKNAEKEFKKALNHEVDDFEKLNYLNSAIGYDNSQSQYYVLRGDTYRGLNDNKRAIEDYQKAIELSPSELIGYSHMATVYAKTDINKAISLLEKAMKIAPKNVIVCTQLANFYSKAEKYEDAIELLTKILGENRFASGILNDRADIYRKIGKLENAKEDIYKSLELNPEDAISFGTLAEIYAEENKTEEFYLNLSVALSKQNGISVVNMKGAKDVYERFKNEKRFLDLLAKYNIDVEEIFK